MPRASALWCRSSAPFAKFSLALAAMNASLLRQQRPALASMQMHTRPTHSLTRQQNYRWAARQCLARKADHWERHALFPQRLPSPPLTAVDALPSQRTRTVCSSRQILVADGTSASFWPWLAWWSPRLRLHRHGSATSMIHEVPAGLGSLMLASPNALSLC